MRKLHRTALTLAGLALAAGTALSAAPPIGATTTALMDFPTGFSEGTFVNVNSGKCLVPDQSNFFGDGDLVVQRTCNDTVGQTWEAIPLGLKTFWDYGGGTHYAYRIVNAGSGLCLDDRDGVTSDGATVQEWTCNTTSTTMQWGVFVDSDTGNLVIFNLRASHDRGWAMAVTDASGATADGVPMELFFNFGPPEREWVFHQIA